MTTKKVKLPGTGISFETDTRTGVEATINQSGSIGIDAEFGTSGGTLQTELNAQLDLTIPETTQLGTSFNIGANLSALSGSLTASLPHISGSLALSNSQSLSLIAQSCIALAGCTSVNDQLLDYSFTQPIIEINTPGKLEDKASIFGLDDLAIPANKVTANVDYIVGRPDGSNISISPFFAKKGVGFNLGNATISNQNLNNSTSLVDGAFAMNVSKPNVLDLKLDLDGLAVMNGLPYPGGAVINVAKGERVLFTGRGDLYDLEAGISLGLSQLFEVTPSFALALEFDRAVRATHNGVDLGMLTSWTGDLSDIPEFMLNGGNLVNVNASLLMGALASNKTSLNFSAVAEIQGLKGELSVFGLPLLSSKPILDQTFRMPGSNTPYNSIEVYRNSFELIEMSSIYSKSFQITAVSEPSGILTSLFSLFMLFTSVNICRKQATKDYSKLRLKS